MSILHTVSQSPKSKLLESCLNAISDEDAILFIEDGVYYCHREYLLEKVPDAVTCFGLREDLMARGLQINEDSSIQSVGYRMFVQLCTKMTRL